MKKLFFMLALIGALLVTPSLTDPPVVHAQAAGAVVALNQNYRPADVNLTTTTTRNFTVSGMASIVIETKGTFTAMTFNVLGSTDGVNFIALPIVAGFIGGAAPGTAATQPVTAANPAVWSTNVKGLTTLQISNICTACTGTVTYHITGQSN